MSDEPEQPTPLLPRLFERDIDVLLQEELIFNTSVRSLLGQTLGLGEIDIRSCQLSVTDATGETNFAAHFAFADKPGLLLIENKIDAAFQPRQPERYREHHTPCQ